MIRMAGMPKVGARRIIVVLRKEFGLSLPEAKECMLIAWNYADSLHDHEEKLAKRLEEEATWRGKAEL